MTCLTSLPEELLLRILVLSAPSTIRHCQQVCQSLYNLVKENAYIQYLLELDASGYTEPLDRRSGSTYIEKLEILRNHRMRLNNPKNTMLFGYELELDVLFYTYTKGTYVQIVGRPDHSAQCFHFHQIPSPNRGTGYRHWYISDLGVNAAHCEIDPEQDLLVLLELVDVEPGYRTCKLHLRTMSTGQPHPEASQDNPILVDMPASASPPKDNFYFEIPGRLLAVMFPSRSSFTPSHVMMWDWRTGTEILRVQTALGSNKSFKLLSDDLFVLPRFPALFQTELQHSDDALGYLDVYQFDPQVDKFTQPRPTMTFALPPWSVTTLPPRIRIECAPVPTMSRTASVLSPRVFDLAPDNRLLCLNIQDALWSGLIPSVSIGALCFPSSTLFDALHKYSGELHPVSIPWSDWGEETSWIDTENIHQLTVFGQRAAGFESDSAGSLSLTMLDFDSQRIKARAMAGAETSGEVCALDNRAHAPSAAEMVFCAGKPQASRKYVKTSIPLGERADTLDASIIFDEDHVIVVKRVSESKGILCTYTF